VIERWELLQVQRFHCQPDLDQDQKQDLDQDQKQDLDQDQNLEQEQRQKLNSDLCDVTSWLGGVLPELQRLQSITPSSSTRDMERNIQKLKVRRRRRRRESIHLFSLPHPLYLSPPSSHSPLSPSPLSPSLSLSSPLLSLPLSLSLSRRCRRPSTDTSF